VRARVTSAIAAAITARATKAISATTHQLACVAESWPTGGTWK